jgi:hypothetical protein
MSTDPDPDPVFEVVDATPGTKRRNRQDGGPLTRLYLTRLPAYVPKHRYDQLPIASEKGNPHDPVEPIPRIRTLYCMTVSILLTTVFYAIALGCIPFIILIVIIVYQRYFEDDDPNSNNGTDTSGLSPYPFSN